MTWAGIVNRAFTADNVGAYLRTLPRPRFVKFIVVHNTGVPSLKTYRGYANRARPISDAQWLRNLENYYRNQQKWKAGPHWFVTPNTAGILAFTPSNVPGTHSPSWNSQSIGVEMVGDYQYEPFDPGVRRNTIALLAELHVWLGLDPGTIRFHREDTRTTHKSCPGKNVDKAQLVADVRARMNEIAPARPVALMDTRDTPIYTDDNHAPETDADTDAHVDHSEPVQSAPRPSWLRRKWRAVTGWFSGGAGLGFFGYLTDWQVVAVLFGGLVLVAVLFTIFMGPGTVREWIKRQVS